MRSSLLSLNRDNKSFCRLLLLPFLAAVALVLGTSIVHAGDDPFKEKFIERLKSAASSVDGVVGVAVKNLRTGEEFLVNGDEVFPQASSIKIHILAEVFRQAREGKFRLTDTRPVPSSARVGGSGILAELGETSVTMSIRDYATLMIVLSDNTATNLLIDLVGMESVNRLLASLGASHTKLQRVMMDSKAAREGRENIGTPREVMSVLENMYRHQLVGEKESEEMLAILRKPKAGPIRAGVSDAVEIADKAGDVEGVRCDVGIVYLPDSPYILCVMTKLLTHDQDGGKVITEISRLSYQYFERLVNSNQYGRRIRR